MNIGGLHIIGGLALLIITTAIIILHLLVLISPFYLFSFWIKSRKPRGEKSLSTRELFVAGLTKSSRTVWLLFLLILVFNFSVYFGQRKNWMTDQNANFAAKEYYVVGQVVSTYRRAISSLLYHPDYYYILVPLNYWQKCIYYLGVKQLPEEDGELAVWAEQWFIYIYSKKNQIARKPFLNRRLEKDIFESIDGKKLSKEEALKNEVQLKPKENEYMDLVWFCLKTMANNDFTDQRMYEERALQIYPGLAHNYAYTVTKAYTLLHFNTSRLFVKMPVMTKRNEQLVGWLKDLAQKWQASEKATSFNKQHPILESMRQMALILTLMDIIDARIWAREFDCNDPYIAILRDTRELFANGENGNPPAYTLMKDKIASEQFRMVALNSLGARFTNFIMEEKCGGSLPGEEDMGGFVDRSISPEDARRSKLRNVFPHELRLLDMEYVIKEKHWTKRYDGTYQWK